VGSSRRIHDRAILDALETLPPEAVNKTVWRITRKGRDPIRGSLANGRWSPGGTVEVLYTSLEREGALAEIGFRLSLEPVWPSRIEHVLHEIAARTERTLHFAAIAGLTACGVNISKYESFDYQVIQTVAAAAHFLGFDGLLVPSARHPSHNLVIFTGRVATGSLTVRQTEPVDWSVWRRRGA
jgi:RES domain-containing protein